MRGDFQVELKPHNIQHDSQSTQQITGGKKNASASTDTYCSLDLVVSSGRLLHILDTFSRLWLLLSFCDS